MNDYLATVPFDLYQLHLFHLVVRHGSFTKAAQGAGLTQSAITRQIQGMESSLGVSLLERTTRSVRLTPPGEFLHRESTRLVGDVDQSLRRLREEFAHARKEVRIGVSRTVALAYLPGFVHANLRRNPEVACRVSSGSSAGILAALESNELDLGVLCESPRLPRTLRVTHRFRDAFTLAAPAVLADSFGAVARNRKARLHWLQSQTWLLIEEDTRTGGLLRRWMTRQGLRIEPAMQLDNFDLIINLVILGLGVSFVPVRALALYGRKRGLTRLSLPERFTRDLAVVMRKHRKKPEHLARFVDQILF